MIQPLAIKAGNGIPYFAKEEDIQGVRDLLTETTQTEAEATAEWNRASQALHLAERAVKRAEDERMSVQRYLIAALTSLAEQQVQSARDKVANQ